jgi:hypothetical protein
MWIFTRWGFFSCTCPRSDFSTKIQIRARRRIDLAMLRGNCPELRKRRIIETPAADYRFRIVVDRRVWRKVAARMADSIDYSNFKNSILQDQPYHDAALTCWNAMFRLQSDTLAGTGGHPQGPPPDTEWYPDDLDMEEERRRMMFDEQETLDLFANEPDLLPSWSR